MGIFPSRNGAAKQHQCRALRYRGHFSRPTMQRLFYTLFLAFFAYNFAQAQGDVPTDVRPQIKTLNPEQKVKLLEYLRRLTAPDIDRQIQAAYSQLSANDKERVVQYADLLKKDDANRRIRTTVQWSRDTLHFGSVEEGRVWMDSVTVKNTGTQPYVFSGSRTSCDCAVLQLPTFPIMPGEQATVRFEFNSTNKLGPVTAGIVLYDNSAPNIRSIFYVMGEVTPRKPK